MRRPLWHGCRPGTTPGPFRRAPGPDRRDVNRRSGSRAHRNGYGGPAARHGLGSPDHDHPATCAALRRPARPRNTSYRSASTSISLVIGRTRPELPAVGQDHAHPSQPGLSQHLLPARQRAPQAELDRSLGDPTAGRGTAEIGFMDHGVPERPAGRGRPQRRVLDLGERRHRRAPCLEQRGARLTAVALEMSGRPFLRCVPVETPMDPVFAQPDEVGEHIPDAPPGTGRDCLPWIGGRQYGLETPAYGVVLLDRLVTGAIRRPYREEPPRHPRCP